ncbi:MAG: hypothetical protein COA70_00025 [Planctomycetota bacterium]|nr:MAG: hypothetical protein COA70_00025 [Planctomycetota bacterium]
MKRVLILMMLLCGACTGPGFQDDGGPTQSLRFSSDWQSDNSPAVLIDPRPQKEQDLETIGRNR